MKKIGIIQNQRVAKNKVEIARNFRKNMTEAESVFWEMIRNRKLLNLKFRRQQIIDGFIVDFYCSQMRLIIEIDGAVHSDEDKKYLDIKRSELLKYKNLHILRFNNDDVFNRPEYIIEKIKSFLASPLQDGEGLGVRSEK